MWDSLKHRNRNECKLEILSTEKDSLWFCANVEVVDNKTSIPTIQDDKKSLYSTTVTVTVISILQQTGNTAIQ